MNQSIDTSPYASPPDSVDPKDCTFYHRSEIPGVGLVGDQWDLRHCTSDYLGRYDFAGKRVLDVGTASGFLTFEMEKRGATVVSFDMAEGEQWDLVPRPEDSPEELIRLQKAAAAGHRRMVNGYWYTHRALNSKAKVFYGNIYDIPDSLGTFDVVYFGMILGHLRDPFRALYSAGRLSRETVIVTNQMIDTQEPIARLMPSVSNDVRRAWWKPSIGCLRQMLALIGFEVQTQISSEPIPLVEDRKGARVTCVSLVATKT